MAGVSGWYSTAYECAADPSKSHGVGWYQDGQLLASTYKNPDTGVAYTPQELQALAGGTTPTGTTPTTTPTTTDTTNLAVGSITTQEEALALGLKPPGYIEGERSPHIGEGELLTTMPTFGAGAAAGIPTPTVTPAPAYEISPEQKAWQEKYETKLTDWVEAGGYGIPEETQALMIQQQTDTLKAREQENIRIMKNNMERRGITNSGYIDANMHMITSNTTIALAGAIADVQIKSALMKMASFEKAMGAASQFLGYLSEQSQLAYAPEFATWQAEQLATMQAWQGKLDVYKMELNQAYQTQNMTLQAQLQSQLNQEQNAFNLLLAEMELEANAKIAQAQGIGSIFGTVLGFLFGK